MSNASTDSKLDVQAWFYARVRADAAEIVAEERLHGAVDALRTDGHSVRQIARILDLPQTRIMRTIGSTGPKPHDGYQPIADSPAAAYLSPAAASDEYVAAHNAAWRHFEPAQNHLEFGLQGVAVKNTRLKLGPDQTAE